MDIPIASYRCTIYIKCRLQGRKSSTCSMESKNPTDPTGSIAASSVAYIQASEWVGSSHIKQLTIIHRSIQLISGSPAASSGSSSKVTKTECSDLDKRAVGSSWLILVDRGFIMFHTWIWYESGSFRKRPSIHHFKRPRIRQPFPHTFV